MSAAYDVEPWTDLAVMVGGATAALAGLLVVAMSINVREILGDSGLPDRAAGALIAMTTPLVLAVLLLIPDQSRTTLAVEILVLGVVVGGLLPWLNRPRRHTAVTRQQWFFGQALPMALIVVPLLLAGIGLATESMGGLSWLPVSILAAVVFGLAQAWVLLIEILR